MDLVRRRSFSVKLRPSWPLVVVQSRRPKPGRRVGAGYELPGIEGSSACRVAVELETWRCHTIGPLVPWLVEKIGVSPSRGPRLKESGAGAVYEPTGALDDTSQRHLGWLCQDECVRGSLNQGFHIRQPRVSWQVQDDITPQDRSVVGSVDVVPRPKLVHLHTTASVRQHVT